jgi:hypothetical protein
MRACRVPLTCPLPVPNPHTSALALQSLELPMTEHVLNNGSVWLHVYVTPEGVEAREPESHGEGIVTLHFQLTRCTLYTVS